MARTPKKSASKQLTKELEETPHSLEVEIDRQIGNLVPQNARDEVVRRVSTTLRAEFFSGPIAHPRHLREYEEICPGAADRIISMAEDQNNHLMEMERRVLQSQVSDQKRGMIIGALAFFSLVIAAFVSAILVEGLALPGLFLGAAALGVIGKFINGRPQSGQSAPPE